MNSTTGLTYLDAFPWDPAASLDSDGDGYPDLWNKGKDGRDSIFTPPLRIDDLPLDPAASLDTDKDGHPDCWNKGYRSSDTGIGLDAFPKNPEEWDDLDWPVGDGVGDNGDWLPSINNNFIYAVVLIFILIIVRYFIIVHRKKKLVYDWLRSIEAINKDRKLPHNTFSIIKDIHLKWQELYDKNEIDKAIEHNYRSIQGNKELITRYENIAMNDTHISVNAEEKLRHLRIQVDNLLKQKGHFMVLNVEHQSLLNELEDEARRCVFNAESGREPDKDQIDKIKMIENRRTEMKRKLHIHQTDIEPGLTPSCQLRLLP